MAHWPPLDYHVQHMDTTHSQASAGIFCPALLKLGMTMAQKTMWGMYKCENKGDTSYNIFCVNMKRFPLWLKVETLGKGKKSISYRLCMCKLKKYISMKSTLTFIHIINRTDHRTCQQVPSPYNASDANRSQLFSVLAMYMWAYGAK